MCEMRPGNDSVSSEQESQFETGGLRALAQRKEGDIKWQGANIFISELLRHESVGLRQMEDDLFEVYFGATLLGEIDGYRKTFIGRR